MLVESVLGNMNEPDWTLRLKEARIDDLVLDQWDAQKSRIRKMTSSGAELSVALARGVRLRDGDILAWDDLTATAVVARVQLGEVMVVHLDQLRGESAELLIRSAVELGHAIG
ncbi:urease accessory protein UreE, partial [Micromonospora sp. M51]|nr:urease accessory protein UreE [Micromonospora sp. M51]